MPCAVRWKKHFRSCGKVQKHAQQPPRGRVEILRFAAKRWLRSPTLLQHSGMQTCVGLMQSTDHVRQSSTVVYPAGQYRIGQFAQEENLPPSISVRGTTVRDLEDELKTTEPKLVIIVLWFRRIGSSGIQCVYPDVVQDFQPSLQ